MTNQPILQNISHPNLSSTVYETLKQALLSGAFRPDSRLKIRDLASQLGVSVTPVRDAILVLAKEQALEMRSPRDIRVPLLNAERFLEIRAIRVELEGLAAYNAAKNITPDQLELLKKMVDENTTALKEGSLEEARKQNYHFHFEIINIANMPVLEGILDVLWLQIAPLVAMAYTESYTNEIRIAHHYEIIEAIQSKDADRARKAIQEDIVDGSQKILDIIQELS